MNDDIFAGFRSTGTAGVSFLDLTPVGALLFVLCKADYCPPQGRF